jgi:hypothetical protein
MQRERRNIQGGNNVAPCHEKLFRLKEQDHILGILFPEKTENLTEGKRKIPLSGKIVCQKQYNKSSCYHLIKSSFNPV